MNYFRNTIGILSAAVPTVALSTVAISLENKKTVLGRNVYHTWFFPKNAYYGINLVNGITRYVTIIDESDYDAIKWCLNNRFVDFTHNKLRKFTKDEMVITDCTGSPANYEEWLCHKWKFTEIVMTEEIFGKNAHLYVWDRGRKNYKELLLEDAHTNIALKKI